MVIAVDFDGTIVEHRYPEIGKEIPFATATLRQLIADGHELILWTVREGDLLQDAVDFCRKRGVTFFAVNRDFEEEDGSNSVFLAKSEPIYSLTTAMLVGYSIGALSMPWSTMEKH